MERNGKLKSTTTPGWGALALLSVTGLVTGCGSGGSASLLEDLEYLSAREGENLMHIINAVDYEALSDITGVEKPEPGAPMDEYRDWIDTLFYEDGSQVFAEASPWVYSPMNHSNFGAYSDAPFGFTLLEVDRIVASSQAGVVEGEYDIESVETAFGESGQQGVLGPVEADDRVDEDVAETYAVELDDRLVYGHSAEAVAGLETGEEKSLAEVEGAAAIAEAIDANDWYWAGIRTSLTDSDHSGDYDWRGHGLWQEDGTQVAHFYWHFPDEETAQNYERTLHVQMGDLAGEWGIEELETEADGQLVISEVHFTESPRVIFAVEGTHGEPFT